MAETPEPGAEGADASPPAKGAWAEVNLWFVREVLPLEAALMHFLRRNWRNRSDFADLRQDVYVRVYEAAQKEIPRAPKPFLLRTARNLLINRVKREQIVPIETFADLDVLGAGSGEAGPDRVVMAREELRVLQDALDRLPPRAREAIVLRQIECLPLREIAARMNIAEKTVERHITIGLKGLADYLYGGPDDLRRLP